MAAAEGDTATAVADTFLLAATEDRTFEPPSVDDRRVFGPLSTSGGGDFAAFSPEDRRVLTASSLTEGLLPSFLSGGWVFIPPLASRDECFLNRECETGDGRDGGGGTGATGTCFVGDESVNDDEGD